MNMIKEIMRLICGLMLLGLSMNISAEVTLKGFEDFNVQVIGEGHLPAFMGVVLGQAESGGLDKYISDVTSIETAACIDEGGIRKFLKKCRKTIKKAKLPEVYAYQDEGVEITYYAAPGQIICLTCVDSIASITVLSGPAPQSSSSSSK